MRLPRLPVVRVTALALHQRAEFVEQIVVFIESPGDDTQVDPRVITDDLILVPYHEADRTVTIPARGAAPRRR